MRTIAPSLLLLAACSATEPEQAPVAPQQRSLPSGPPPEDLPNFLIIDIDSLRADRIGTSQQAAALAPNLTALALSGVHFENAYAQAAWTVPSLIAQLTGRYPPLVELSEGRITGWGNQVHLLPEILGWYGYTTAITWGHTIPAEFSATSRGFTVFDTEDETGPDAYHRRVCQWLRERPEGPFLLMVHNIDLHAPSVAVPAEFLRDRVGPGVDHQVKLLDDQLRIARKTMDSAERVALLTGIYDAYLSWYDRSVGQMLDCLAESGAAADTVVVVVSDHGQELFDHGLLGHGRYHYDSVLRVPLVVMDPRSEVGGHVQSQVVQGIDLAPTILDLAGIPVDEGMQGRSLLPLLERTGQTWPEREIFALSSLMAASLQQGSWKLAVHFPSDPDQRSRREAAQVGVMVPGAVPQLFDLATDPGETRDLAAEQPERAAALQAQLLERVNQQVLLTRGGGAEPVNEEFLQLLQERGYWEHVHGRGKQENPRLSR